MGIYSYSKCYPFLKFFRNSQATSGTVSTTTVAWSHRPAPRQRRLLSVTRASYSWCSHILQPLTICLLAALTILCSGCATTSRFTAASTKNVNVSDIKVDRSKFKGHTEGDDCQYIIIFIPTSGPPNMKEAMDRALENKGGNLLLDARIHYSRFIFPLIFGASCWTVSGDAYDTYK